jgi:excisionase family DNA binding protein
MIDVGTEHLITLGMAAETLLVHPRTAYRWAVTGRLEAVRCGRQWRTSREAVARFTAAHTSEDNRQAIERLNPARQSKAHLDAMRDLAALGID